MEPTRTDFEHFTEQQRSVIYHQDGPMLVLAGAGSGKTASVVSRAGRMIQEQTILPEQHLMLTFSKKAAAEMRERLEDMIGNGLSDRSPIRTFHAFGDQMIRAFPEQLGRGENHTVLDEKDQRGLFVRVLREIMNVPKEKMKDLNIKEWLSAYSKLAQDGHVAGHDPSANAFIEKMQEAGVKYRNQFTWLWRAFSAFERFKAEQNVCDFNDLLTLPVRALESNPQLAREAGRMYPYMTVDETQDTNLAQYRLIRALTKDHGNIVVVGDDDQSLYSWRGAHPQNIMDFHREFKPKVVKLEENFRSGRALVASAAKHISNNKERMPKSPFSQKDSGPPPLLAKHTNTDMLAESMIEEIKDAINNLNVPPKEIAILSRTNKILEIIQPHLAAAGVPFEVYGGMRLLEKKESRLMISLARLVTNPRDQAALAVVVDGMKGFGEKAFTKLCILAEQECQGHLFDAAEKMTGRNQVLMERLGRVIDRLKTEGPEALLNAVRMNMDIIGENHTLCLASPDASWEELDKDNNPKLDALQDGSLLRQLFSTESKEAVQKRMGRLEDLQAWIMRGLADPTPEVRENPWQAVTRALLDEPDAADRPGGAVTLTTIHKSKGLEFQMVHVAGFSQGLMPLENSQGEVENMEEERRLSYVAITRAKEVCRLHHADIINLGYARIEGEPSVFLEEVDHVEVQSMVQFDRKREHEDRKHRFLAASAAIPRTPGPRAPA